MKPKINFIKSLEKLIGKINVCSFKHKAKILPNNLKIYKF